MMDGKELPLALGVIRDVKSPVYNEEIEAQIADIRARKGYTSLRDMVVAGNTWTIE